MSNIFILSTPYKQPLNSDRITDVLITTLYDLLPNKISFWSVKLAQAKFNERQDSGRSTWLDKMQVYVGLPDWVVDEQQMHVEAMPHLKCPFGLLETLSELTEISVNCAIPFRQTDTLTRKPYDAFLHTYTFEAKLQSIYLEDDIEQHANDCADHDSQHDNLVIKACNNVCVKRDYLINRIHRHRLYERNMDTLRTALSTCVHLAKGDTELLKAFLGVQRINTRAINDARVIYGNLDIEEFFDWASDHFGLDDYYDDANALVVHLQEIIKDDGLLLVKDELYSFMADMVNRSVINAELLVDF